MSLADEVRAMEDTIKNLRDEVRQLTEDLDAAEMRIDDLEQENQRLHDGPDGWRIADANKRTALEYAAKFIAVAEVDPFTHVQLERAREAIEEAIGAGE